MSAAALSDGLEWNVRVSAVESPAVVAKFRHTFDGYWNDNEFEPYDPKQDQERLTSALNRERREDSEPLAPIEVRPYPFQEEILDRLVAERLVHDRRRNLVVAATGTGKTVIAALDFRRERDITGRSPSLLFVAHRKEILRRSRSTFRQALRDPSFGELFVDGYRPAEGQHVFASVQSLSHVDLSSIRPDAYDVVIVDEFHHAEAPTYRRLLEHLRPSILLGLTATPERTDGTDVRAWFDGRIAAELRLWDAIDRGLLSPFQYFGIHDGVDVSSAWKRGQYQNAELEGIYTGHHVRAKLIYNELLEHVADARRMRALGFCVGVDHARFMAREFDRRGIPSLALTGKTPRSERDDAIRKLISREINIIFSVDLFNEGVDIPEVDTVLFLRPTESATLFLQQLGRGLRLCEGKECLTVLDFIGRQHQRFRFDLRFRAATGTTRRQVTRAIEQGFPVLPAGCSMQLDRASRELVLENVRQSIGSNKRSLLRELRSMGRDVGLAEFLHEAGLELADIYRGGRTWTDLRRGAGLPTLEDGPQEARLGKGLGRFVHSDDPEYLEFLSKFFSAEAPSPPGDQTEFRRLLMITAVLFGAEACGHPFEALGIVWDHEAIQHELLALIEVRRSAIAHEPRAFQRSGEIPLKVHCQYRRDEILAAFGQVRKGRLYQPREGVWFDEESRCNLLFVTFKKAEKDYSPSTMYLDHAVSRTEFHWQSQSTTTATKKKGLRHLEHRELGITPLLFVREHKKDDRGIAAPYTFLGPAELVQAEGTRPMNITWRLEAAMPVEVYRAARMVA